MANEIERKFVVRQLPGPEVLRAGVAVRQGYVAEDGEVEVRVRVIGEESLLTVKAGSGLVRTEVEVPIDRDAADALWRHTAGRRVEKLRHRIDVDGVAADVDVYGGELSGLSTAEVEFATEADAAAFTPPDWFGREVTGDRQWSNASLAKNGLPT